MTLLPFSSEACDTTTLYLTSNIDGALMLAIHGEFQTLSVTVRIEPYCVHSVLSTDFSLQNSLPISWQCRGSVVERNVHGPISIPTVTGHYICSFPMDIGYVAGADLVLGSDWVIGCGMPGLGVYLPNPDPAELSQMSPGFVWCRYMWSSECFFFSQ